MVELGYAAKAIGWSKILCIYNTEFGKIEDLTFDIRNRKPIIFNIMVDKQTEKKRLIKIISSAIKEIKEKSGGYDFIGSRGGQNMIHID